MVLNFAKKYPQLKFLPTDLVNLYLNIIILTAKPNLQVIGKLELKSTTYS